MPEISIIVPVVINYRRKEQDDFYRQNVVK